MNSWNYFDMFYVLTIKNSPQIPIIKKHLQSVGIRNYKICKFTPNCTKDKCPTLHDIFAHNKQDQNTLNVALNHFKLI